MKVVDASVVMKVLQAGEINRDLAEAMVRAHVEGVEKLIAPDLLYIEVANALSTKTKTTQGKIKESLEWIYDLNLIREELGQTELVKASIWAKKYNVAVYDMIYAVLANKLGVEMVTADRKFAQKTGFKFVKVLGE